MPTRAQLKYRALGKALDYAKGDNTTLMERELNIAQAYSLHLGVPLAGSVIKRIREWQKEKKQLDDALRLLYKRAFDSLLYSGGIQVTRVNGALVGAIPTRENGVFAKDHIDIAYGVGGREQKTPTRWTAYHVAIAGDEIIGYALESEELYALEDEGILSDEFRNGMHTKILRELRSALHGEGREKRRIEVSEAELVSNALDKQSLDLGNDDFGPW